VPELFDPLTTENPLVSILTTVKNGERSIALTMTSVLKQCYENIEYIVIDGGSSDNTAAVIGSIKDDRIRFSVETDAGVYYGMNNAISKANGKIIAILNSGDTFYNDSVIDKVVRLYSQQTDENVVFNGGIKLVDNDGNALADVIRDKSILHMKYMLMPINHPAFFVPKYVYEKYGVFNTAFRTGADYEFVLRLSRKARFVFFSDICTIVPPLGLSSYANNILPVLDECYSIRSLYVNKLVNKILYALQYLFFTASRLKKKLAGQ